MKTLEDDYKEMRTNYWELPMSEDSGFDVELVGNVMFKLQR